MMSQIGKLAYEIEMRIQIDKEDFMHDINQYEFKIDGQNKGRGPRGMFQEATQAMAWGEQRNRYRSKAGDPRVKQSSMLKSVIIQVKKVTCESMLEFIPMQIEDSKSLTQNGYAQRMKMLIPSRY